MIWSKNAIDIGCIYSVTPIKIQVDERKPLLNIHQYPMNSEAIQGFKPIIKEYIKQGLIVPRTSCFTTLILS